MRLPIFLVLSAGVLSAISGCGSSGSDTLPGAMAGSYVRDELSPGSSTPQRVALTLAPTGMSVGGAAVGASQSVTVGGTPVMGGSVKVGSAGSALFKKVNCTSDASCRFTTENGCEGTLTRDAAGDMVVIATGPCEAWSGKWLSEKSAPPPAAASAAASATTTSTAPAVPSPQVPVPAVTTMGQGSAQPTSTATAQPSASGTATGTPTTSSTGIPTSIPTSTRITCLASCNDSAISCARNCKVGDLDCMSSCGDKASQCSQKCQ